MSTGKRLAKRSIIGTRVCAPGPDGLWYSGVIQDVKTLPNRNSQNENNNTNNNNCINLTSDTKYMVRFDFKTQSFQQQQQLLLNQQILAKSSQVAAQTPVTMEIDNRQSAIQIQELSSSNAMDTTPPPLPAQQQQTTVILQQKSSSPATGVITAHHPHHHHHHAQQQHSAIISNSNTPAQVATVMTHQHIQQSHNNSLSPAAAIANIMISPAQSIRRNAMIKEFREDELIGPGFRSIMGVQLRRGQRVFLTYNGREVSGDVISHNMQKDEVIVRITPIGYEEPLELKKRLEEVRLLESRRSARLADQERDTDFARLADMAGDRRRASHSIDVPLALTQHNSRKRRPSYSQDERDTFITQFRDDDQMDACNAALVLMSLSCSPRSPSAGQWNTVLGSSPGSSSASWSSGTSSPPLSDDGNPPIGDNTIRIRTTSLSTSDEGIVMDYNDEAPRKRRAHGPIFQCTWKGCGVIETTVAKIERHVRDAHLGPKKPRPSYDDDGTFSDSDHEEEFYYTEIEDEDEGKAPSPPSPPTLSHRDMARPPHEDPEYQRQIVGNFRQGLLALSQQSTANKSSHSVNVGPINIPTSPLAHHNYTWTAQQSPVSPIKHARWSPRPSTSSAPYPSPTYMHHHNHHHHPQQYNINQQPQQNHHQQQPVHHPHHQQQANITITQNGHIQQSNSNNSSNNKNTNNNNGGLTNNLSHSAPTSTSYLTVNPNIHHAVTTTGTSHHSKGPSSVNGAANLSVTASAVAAHHLQSSNQQNHRSPQSPHRRTRGENKKCRKVYGMDHKDQWCTQCKWKKACSRFGD